MKDSEEGMTLSLSDPRNHWMVNLWEDYCAKFSVCSPAEIDVDEVDLLRNSMMEEWQSYASTFGIAAPEDQLPPDTWGGELSPPDDEANSALTSSKTGVSGLIPVHSCVSGTGF